MILRHRERKQVAHASPWPRPATNNDHFGRRGLLVFLQDVIEFCLDVVGGELGGWALVILSELELLTFRRGP